MRTIELSKRFPVEERYSLTDQLRRSSRSVAANISEAWRQRRYVAAWVSKLNDAESKAAETQTWIELALRCGFLSQQEADELDRHYDKILGQLVAMIDRPGPWVIRPHHQVPASPRLPVPASRRLGDTLYVKAPPH